MNRRWTLPIAVAAAIWVSAACPLLAQMGGQFGKRVERALVPGPVSGGAVGPPAVPRTSPRPKGIGLDCRYTGADSIVYDR